jgi:hypothetical protein
MPDHLKAIASSWINLNPGWEYRYVNQVQRDETVKRYPIVYEIYKYQLPVIQSDVWRFIALYEEGGCYADMDSVPTMALDYMIDSIGGDPEIITVPKNKGQGNTYGIISKKNSPIMKSVVESMDKWSTDFDDKLQPFNSYVEKAYSDDNSDKVSQLFDANHSLDYKKKFLTSTHSINNYGTVMKYEDFVTENGLELIYKFDNK